MFGAWNPSAAGPCAVLTVCGTICYQWAVSETENQRVLFHPTRILTAFKKINATSPLGFVSFSFSELLNQLFVTRKPEHSDEWQLLPVIKARVLLLFLSKRLLS